MGKNIGLWLLSLAVLLSAPAWGSLRTLAETDSRTLTGGLAGTTVVTPVTDHTQTAALGESLLAGRRVGMYSTGGKYQNYAPYFDNKSAEPTHEAGLSSLLTDGDYYLPDELALVKNGDTYVANPDAPTYAKSTAYNRASTFWADCKGIWVDMGEVYAVDTVFVASGVHFQPVTMAAAATMTEQERAAAEQRYMERTFVRDLQVYISVEKETLFQEENRVFTYRNTEDLALWNWANLYTLDKAVEGQYIGIIDKNFTAASGTDYLAEFACYGKAADDGRVLRGGLAKRTRVVPVTDHAQTDALGDSLLAGKSPGLYNTAGQYHTYAPYLDNKALDPTMEATYASVLTDNDYYLPAELKLKTLGKGFAANTYNGQYVQSTAAARTSCFWADAAGLWVDMGDTYEIGKVFVASGVHFQPVTMAAAATMTEQERAAAESRYMERTFVRDLQVYISADRDTLFNEENRVFSYTNTTDLVTWSWANIYELENPVTGRYIGFRDDRMRQANGTEYFAELACYDIRVPFDKNLQTVTDPATGISATISRLGSNDRSFFESLGGLQVVRTAYPAQAQPDTLHRWLTVDSDVYTLQLVDRSGRVLTDEEMGERYWTLRFPTAAGYYQVMGLLRDGQLTYVRNSYTNAEGTLVLAGNGWGNDATLYGNSLSFVYLRYHTLEEINALEGYVADDGMALTRTAGVQRTAAAACPEAVCWGTALLLLAAAGGGVLLWCRRERRRTR